MHLDSRVTEGNVVGPYLDKKSGRRLVTVYRSDGTHGSMTYARWLMQEHLGRKLEPWEHVDHKDENRLNDLIENYQILTLAENTRKSWEANPTAHGRGVERGWTHGTVYGWMQKRCDCEVCGKARREWNDARNEQRRKGSKKRGQYGRPSAHGEALHYRRGCRCEECRGANAAAAREQRNKPG